MTFCPGFLYLEMPHPPPSIHSCLHDKLYSTKCFLFLCVSKLEGFMTVACVSWFSWFVSWFSRRAAVNPEYFLTEMSLSLMRAEIYWQYSSLDVLTEGRLRGR